MVDFAGSGIPQFGGQMVGPDQLAQLQQIMGANWGMPLAMGGTLGDLLGHLFGGAPQPGTMGGPTSMTNDVMGGTPGSSVADSLGALPDVKLPDVGAPPTPGMNAQSGFNPLTEPGRYGSMAVGGALG